MEILQMSLITMLQIPFSQPKIQTYYLNITILQALINLIFLEVLIQGFKKLLIQQQSI
jgi:hypothetical protein